MTSTATRRHARHIWVTSARTLAPSPSVTGPSEDWTTTWMAELALPPKLHTGEHRSTKFAAWGERLWKRPVAWALASLVVLLVLAAPLLG